MEGGSYLGLCAGAYYACSGISFEPGTRCSHCCPGFKSWTLRLLRSAGCKTQFVNVPQCSGRLEVTGDRELKFFPGWAHGSVYPGFCYQSESGAVACPVRFKLSKTRAAQPRAENASQSPSVGAAVANKSPSWSLCHDYSNGGPWFVLDKGSSYNETVRQIAVYAGVADRTAAVACKVGQGVAVLCGTHPELHPDWLLPAEDCTAAVLRQHTCLQNDLHASHASRREFWLRLLQECRLDKAWMRSSSS